MLILMLGRLRVRGCQVTRVEMHTKGLNICSRIQDRDPDKDRDVLDVKQQTVFETTEMLEINKRRCL